MTRPVTLGGNDIIINRDANDVMERGEATMRGDETPMTSEKIEEGSSSQTQTATEGSPKHEHASDDFREETPPDGTEIIAEWKEGRDNIIERRKGPGEEVEVEVQRNVYGPGETTTHSVNIAQDTAHDVVSEIRHKLAQSLPEHTNGGLERMMNNVRQRFAEDVHQAEEAASNVTDKAIRALSPSSHPRPNPDEEDEGWQSDREGEPSASTSGTARRHSRSPKSKPPKINVIRPQGQGRRRSIRRGMLGSRILNRHGEDAPRHGTPTPQESDAEDDAVERGRRLPPSRGPGIGPRHARIDSLRSLDTRSRDASPARSIRWADQDDGASTGGRVSGTTTPGILSPSSPMSPLPGDHEDGEDSPHGSASHVRFSVPEPVAAGRQ